MAAQRPVPSSSCRPSPPAEWTESGDRWTFLKPSTRLVLKTDEDSEVSSTLALALGTSGFRTGPLLALAAHLPRGPAFLLDVMLSRMFVTRGGPDEAEGFPEP